MRLKIYNSLTQKKEDFVSIVPDQVKMYVCGPTVYDLLHVGNFRGPIFFNLVRNWLEHKGFKVEFVYNYTDVDDRIIKKAASEKKSSTEVSEFYISEFEKDFKALGLKKHSLNPKVTEFMAPIIEFVKSLIDLGVAYEIAGDVYFSVEKFKKYGELSHKNLDDLAAGFRIEIDQRKKHVSDFALWKKSKPGEPFWSSPWGEGRPGWHIECSAMIKSLLGDSIDIHGGGMDLLFPHHENEKAQSEALNQKPFVRYWMHNNMVQFGQAKMSKSLGNVVTGRGFMTTYNPEILKFMVLSVHYRSPMDLSDQAVAHAITALARIYSSLALAQRLSDSASLMPINAVMEKAFEQADQGFEKALDDDFNTAEMMARLFELVRTFNGEANLKSEAAKASANVFFKFITERGKLLSLFQEPPKEFLTTLDDMLLAAKKLNRQDIDQKVLLRIEARKNKDFKTSDQLRDELKNLGIRLQDNAEGTLWEVDK